MRFKLMAIIDKEINTISNEISVQSKQSELFDGKDSNTVLLNLQNNLGQMYNIKKYVDEYKSDMSKKVKYSAKESTGANLDILEKLTRFEYKSLLNNWEFCFIADIKNKIDTYGSGTFLSDKQINIIERIMESNPDLLITQLLDDNSKKPF